MHGIDRRLQARGCDALLPQRHAPPRLCFLRHRHARSSDRIPKRLLVAAAKAQTSIRQQPKGGDPVSHRINRAVALAARITAD